MSSRELLAHIDDSFIDVALVSVGHGQTSGMIIHREPLVWAGLRHGCAHERTPLPLAVSHVGCCWRRMALDALSRAGIAHRIAYSSRHYLGQLAPMMAGLAIAPLPRSIVQGDLKVIGEEAGLPPIGYCEIELRRSATATGTLFEALASHIENNFRGYDAAVAA
jgi:DNA-binding transcriptional LysR family regulator